jgi:flagellar biosynthesis protein FliP
MVLVDGECRECKGFEFECFTRDKMIADD